MSTTDAIDEKKTEESGFTPDFKGFATNYISSIIFTIGISIFIIGGLGLYTTKIAQSNILPDNIELAPYTVIDRIVTDIPIDINIMRTTMFSDNKDTFSQKALFNSREYLDSFNNSFLCSLKKNADPNGGLFSNGPLFFSSVYENLVAKNFLAINTIFFYLSYIPESIIMLVYGFFGIFLWISLYFFNVCISIFYHIINIPQLFRTVSQENDKNWESTKDISFLRMDKLFIFFFWFFIGLFSTFVTPFFFTIYGLAAPLFASYYVKNKRYNIFDFIKDTFVYKKVFFFILATLSLCSNGLKYLGKSSIIGIIVAIVFAYVMGLYTNEMPQPNTDGFTAKIRQNMKQSKVIDNKTSLVEICKQIPADNEKIEKIIKDNPTRFRKLTKPKSVGGDADNDEIQPSEQLEAFKQSAVEPIAEEPTVEPTAEQPLTQSVEQPLTQLETAEPTEPTAEPLTQSAEEPLIQSAEEPLTQSAEEQLTQSVEEPPTQSAAEPTAEEPTVEEPTVEPLTQSVEPLTQSVEPLTQSVEQPDKTNKQSGGRKRRGSNYTKKYNVKLT